MKKVLIIGAGAMGTAFSFPLLDNNHKVTLTEPYNTKLINQLLKKRKFHPSLKIILPKKLLILEMIIHYRLRVIRKPCWMRLKPITTFYYERISKILSTVNLKLLIKATAE